MVDGCLGKDVSFRVLACFDLTPLVDLRENYPGDGNPPLLRELLLNVMHPIPAGRKLATIVLA